MGTRKLAAAFFAWASYALSTHASNHEHSSRTKAISPPLPNYSSEFAHFEKVQQVPPSQPPPSEKGSWLGYGGNIYNNHRAASDAVLNTTNVRSLVPVCQKTYEPGISAAPLVKHGIAYYPTWGRLLVALDYKSCSVLWNVNVTELILEFKGGSKKDLDAIRASNGAFASRTTPVVDGDVLFIGTLARALVVAIDKRTGHIIDTLQLDSHLLAVLTQSPTLYHGCLFIGTSTTESGRPSFDPDYRCCSHHGSMNAVALQHGRLTILWTTYTIPLYGNFSGASVWGSQPAIDLFRQQVFIGTGQLLTLPPEFERCQDANLNLTVKPEQLANEPCLPRNVYQTSLLALDIETGMINWARTLAPVDAWTSACTPNTFPGGPPNPPPGPACPKHPGKDVDFGMAPTFVLGSEHTPYGKDVVVVGQKNGNLYALSAQAGAIYWTVNTSPGGLEGGLNWGIAVDDRAVYYTAINSGRVAFALPNGTTISNSAFGAASLKNGSMLWQTKAPRNTVTSVIPVVVNDVVLTGVTGNHTEGQLVPTGPGSFLAMSKSTGEILEEIPLDSYFHAGIATMHDYVMFGTGYGGFEVVPNGSFNVWQLRLGNEGSVASPLGGQAQVERGGNEMA
jgi:outer membrane protein assembly factor BamB